MVSNVSSEQAEFRAALRDVVQSIDAVYGPEGYLLIGAFARDVHVHLRAGRPLPRATADVDISIAAPNFDAYRTQLDRLDRAGTLRTRRRLPLPADRGLPLDVLPFGGIAPEGIVEVDEVLYDVRGLEDAFRHADVLTLDGADQVRLPTLSSLIGLKLISWAMRRKPTDAGDLAILLEISADDPYADEVWESDSSGAYGYELALEGPLLQGRRLAATFGDRALARIREVLDPAGDLVDELLVVAPARGVREPSRHAQFDALRRGIQGEGNC